MFGLMRVRTEEATFTFSWIDWEASFKRPFFKVIEGFLDRVCSLEKKTRWRDHQHRVSVWSPDGGF